MDTYLLSDLEILIKEKEYWHKKLSGDLNPLMLRLSSKVTIDIQEKRVTTILPFELSQKLRQLTKDNDLSLYIFLLAAFKIVLFKYTGMTDITVGSPRYRAKDALHQDQTGLLIALRDHIENEMPFREFVKSVKCTVLDAYKNQHYPFHAVAKDLNIPDAELLCNPVFLCKTIHNGNDSSLKRSNLIVIINPCPEEIECEMLATTAFLDHEVLHQFAQHYAKVLAEVIGNVEVMIKSVPMLTEQERQCLLFDRRDSHRIKDGEELNVVELFERQVQERPHRVAIRFGKHRLTFRELSQASDRLAHLLIEEGMKEGTVVGVRMETSPELLIGMMAIWKARGTYVPIDVNWPIDRQHYIFEDSGACMVLVNADDGQSPTNEPRRFLVKREELIEAASEKYKTMCKPSDPAYIMYTSGSTGQPKGVVVEHRNLTHFLSSIQTAFHFDSSDVFIVIASPSFDIILFELLCVLVQGGTAELLSRQEILDMSILATSLRSATVFHAVPSLMQLLISHVNSCQMFTHKIRKIFIGGEVVSIPLLHELNRIFATSEITVLYGPTEATIVCMSYTVPRVSIPDRCIIGEALSHCWVRLYNDNGDLAPIGALGEIYIGGTCVTREYLNQPIQTKEKFIAIDGRRFYRSGDIGRRLADGNIEFIGRRDRQVKIRGIRVELAEIEIAIQAYPGINQVAVLLQDEGVDEKRLLAYLVASKDFETTHDLHAFLRKRLPQWIVPSKFIQLKHLPLSQNGKVDRKALAVFSGEPIAEKRPITPPRTKVEEAIAKIWKELLDLSDVDVEQTFFELGGHSLLLLQAHARLKGLFGEELSVVDMFRYPTIRTLAEYHTNHNEESYRLSHQRGAQRRVHHATTGGRYSIE
ncbi:MAG: amino acid adenylation domain-containing protein [Bryobacteraceae bacterium]|nr:amino acid adenylation domain-containing protein [Bryobacteraceae bacterium]